MEIRYDDPISGDELAALTKKDAIIMAKILYDVRIETLDPNTPAYQNTHIVNYVNECMRYLSMPEPFLIRAYDETTCVAFRFVYPAKYLTVVNLKKRADIEKYGHIRDWYIEQGLDFDKGVSAFFGIHKDYNGQGIGTKIRNLCNEEAKRRGYEWILVTGIDSKSRWDWTINYYKRNGYQGVMSDISVPTELGYGKFCYYKL